jgi:TRAP-type transport system small permease protein
MASEAGSGLVDRLLGAYCRVIEAALVACLSIMVVLVFGNVVLRYAFNSGITVSEEISRWLFVWLTFMGGVVGLREHSHLGTEMLLDRLGPGAKKACIVAGYLLMLWCCWLLFRGSLEQTKINWDVSAPSSGASMAWFYGVGVVFGVSAAAVLLNDLVKIVSGRLSVEDLHLVKESEDEA